MITLNSTSIVQPSDLKEEIIPIQTDVTALDGSMQRNNMGQKYQATLSFSNLNPSDYQTIITLITSGAAVSYTNTLSDYAGGSLSFTGLPTFQESNYVAGASLQRDLTVVLRQV